MSSLSIPWRVFWLQKKIILFFLVINLIALQIIVGRDFSHSLGQSTQVIVKDIKFTTTNGNQRLQIEKILSTSNIVDKYQKVSSHSVKDELTDIGLQDVIKVDDIVTFSIKLKSSDSKEHLKFKEQLMQVLGENPLSFSESLEKYFVEKDHHVGINYWRYLFVLNFLFAIITILYIVDDIKKYFRITTHFRQSYLSLWLPLCLFLSVLSLLVFIVLSLFMKTKMTALLLSLLLSFFMSIIVKKNEK